MSARSCRVDQQRGQPLARRLRRAGRARHRRRCHRPRLAFLRRSSGSGGRPGSRRRRRRHPDRRTSGVPSSARWPRGRGSAPSARAGHRHRLCVGARVCVVPLGRSRREPAGGACVVLPARQPWPHRSGRRTAPAARGDPRRPNGGSSALAFDRVAVLDQPRVRRRRRQLRRVRRIRADLPRPAQGRLGRRRRSRLHSRRPLARRAGPGRPGSARLAIRGASAGGYTTLAALARDDTPFAAGADHFGVADLEALAAETHKFESRYLDGLIGPYPQRRDVYVERSPVHHVEKLTRPLIVLQEARPRGWALGGGGRGGCRLRSVGEFALGRRRAGIAA